MNFERLKIRHKYLIDMKDIDGNIIRACSLLRRISGAIIDFESFSLTITLSDNEKDKQECREIVSMLREKQDKLEDELSKFNICLKFDL